MGTAHILYSGRPTAGKSLMRAGAQDGLASDMLTSAAVHVPVQVLYPFGRGVIQVVFPTVITYLSMALFPRRCLVLAWIFNFGYLVWLQVITASGLAWNQGALWCYTAGSTGAAACVLMQCGGGTTACQACTS